MALIVEYHVVADMYPIGHDAISAGMIVRLNAAGLIIPSVTANAVDNLGIAGDSALAAAGQTTAYSDQVTLGAGGGWQSGTVANRWTENRVSDFYDETTASSKMTVYNGGGKFWVSDDLIAPASAAPAIGNEFESSGVTAGNWLVAGAGAGQTVGICTGAAQAYPSGVPGTDVQGSITLGDYFCVQLRI